MIGELLVFFFFFFLYTCIWYLLTPVLDTVLGAFASVSVPSSAQTPFNNVIAILRYGWTWIGIFALLSTVIYLYIRPYRKEAESIESYG